MGSPKRRGEGRRTEHGLLRSPEESGQKGPETEEEKPEAIVSWRPREQGLQREAGHYCSLLSRASEVCPEIMVFSGTEKSAQP